MDTIKIINPAAGKGKALSQISDNVRYYVSKSVGDVEKFVYATCKKEPETYFIICGGDGTLNEAVNGIMKAGAGDKALLSVLPLGTGNDFLRYEPKPGEPIKADVIEYNGKYFINVLNIGFDCDVVIRTDEIKKKPLISGSMAYIAGVGSTFMKPFGKRMKVTVTSADGGEETFEDEYMLCVAANAQYYGGGFMPAPLAEINDGIIDVLLVKKMARARFISIIGSYKAGKHMDPETGDVIDKYKDVMTYRKCVKLHISGADKLCADGEIEPCGDIDISIVPSAVNVLL